MSAYPQSLTVLYDPACELCRRSKQWISKQEQLVPIEFVAATDPSVAAWSEDLVPVGDQLVVVSELGATWLGSDAFIMCFWALRRYRNIARRLQVRGVAPVARAALHALSDNRENISFLLGSKVDRSAAEQYAANYCEDGQCGTPDVAPDAFA